MGRPKKQVSAKEDQSLTRLRATELFAAAQGKVPSAETLNRSIGHLQHGVLASALLSEQERVFFYAMIERYEADYVLNSSADWMQTELICLLFLQAIRAMEAKNWDAFAKIDSGLRSHLREMKASKRGREGEESKEKYQSPAEWAAALVEKVQRIQAETRPCQVAGDLPALENAG